MNYIVFDLEWNQSPIGQAGEHPRMPFEIIEIGAVKLDENYNVIDEFSRLVKPKIYTKLHKIIKQMLSYDEKDLKKEGVPFKHEMVRGGFGVLYMGIIRSFLSAE